MTRWAPVGSALFLVACLAPAVCGQPRYLPGDPPHALVQADPGRTTFACTAGADGWTAELARSLTRSCDVAAVVGSARPPALRARWLVVPTLFPLQTVLELGTDRIAALGALHLGPMRIVGDRTWGRDARVRLAVHAAGARLAAAAGVDWVAGSRPFVSASWFPNARPLAALTFLVSPTGCRVTIGATW